MRSVGLPFNNAGYASAFGGYRIIEDANLTDEQRLTVRRTWRERLWSWPWRPWRATKIVVDRVPSRAAYQIAPGVLVAHPQFVAELRRQFGAPK